MFLGWTTISRRDYFVRQLRDIKISLQVETFGRGKALALAHARSGLSDMLSGYMGNTDVFDEAIAAFSVAYADQNEKDHAALASAVKKGKVEAVFEKDK
jgi:hypothetical protein